MKTRHSTSPAAIILAAFCLLLAGDTASAITPGGVICSENLESAAECDGDSGPRAISDIPGGVRGKSDAATGTTLAHYAVFDASPEGAVRPVYHTYVWLASPPRSLSLPELQAAVSSPGRNAQRAAVTLETANGRVAFRTVVEIPRWVRGEFPGETPGAEIDGHFFPLKHSYFVVRAPVSGDDGLFRIEAPGRVDASVSMRALAPVTEPAPRAAFVGSTAQGNPGNRVDLLIMGDGYTAGQGALFETDAQNTANAFLDITPYAEYRNFVNVETLFTPSAQSGADHPPYSASCEPQDPSCCADPTATFDPLAGTYVDTAFDARYCYNNIHRLIDVDETAIFAAAAAVPDYDQILVLVNDTTPGAAGGQGMTVVSMQLESVQVAQHEYGHSFTNLADEYDDPYPGYLPCSDLYGPPCEANVTDVTQREEIKWAPWIDPATAVPTAESLVVTDDQTVGLFEGARYLSSVMHRPGDWCLMRTLGQEFCPVAAQSYVLRLYNGSWGMPWEGIDIIEPGTEFPAPGNVYATEPVQFSVDLLQPVGGPPLEVQWYVDGLAKPGATSDGFLFNPPGPGAYTVSLDVADPTELVLPAMAYGAQVSSRSWTVVVTGDGIVGDADCDEDADAVDALFVLRYVAGMTPFAACIGAANVKCDDGTTSVDALFILRYVVDLPVNLPAGCDPVGTPLSIN